MSTLKLRVDGLGAGAVAGDPVVDRRDLLAADGAQHELARRRAGRADLRLRHLRGEVADEEAGLLGLEGQPVRVRRACRSSAPRGKSVIAHFTFGNCFAAVLVASASRNPFMTTALAPQLRGGDGVRQVVGLGGRDVDLRLDAEVLLGLQAAEVAEVVEALVVQPGRVGVERGLEGAGARGRRRAARRLGPAAAARGDAEHEDGRDDTGAQAHGRQPKRRGGASRRPLERTGSRDA